MECGQSHPHGAEPGDVASCATPFIPLTNRDAVPSNVIDDCPIVGHAFVLARGVLVRRGLESLLRERGYVTGSGSGREEYQRFCASLGTRLDLLICDAAMAKSATVQQDSLCRPRRIIVVSSRHAPVDVLQWAPSNLCAWLRLHSDEAQVGRLLDSLHDCDTPREGRSLRCSTCPLPGTLRPTALPLSVRERAVFELIGRGLGPSEIGETLGVKVKTVESYRERIKQKLGVSSAAELIAVAIAWRNGSYPADAG